MNSSGLNSPTYPPSLRRSRAAWTRVSWWRLSDRLRCGRRVVRVKLAGGRVHRVVRDPEYVGSIFN